jgi:hypothetical protein
LLGQVVDEDVPKQLTITTYCVAAFGLLACGTTYFFPFDEKRTKRLAIKSSETVGFINPSNHTDPRIAETFQSKTKEIDNLLT